jgi:hypothetical protein
MPVASPSPSVLDWSEQSVAAGRASYRPGVRRALDGVASPGADSNGVPAEAAGGESDDRETRRGETLPIGGLAIRRPPGMGAFQFVVLSTLRAAQLMRGCRPRVDSSHKATVIAQLEVSTGKVVQLPNEAAPVIAAPIANVPAIVVGT